MKKKILLTGYPGWLGDELHQKLSPNYEIFTTSELNLETDNHFCQKISNKACFKEFKEKFSLIDFKAIIHCAGIIHPKFNNDFNDINFLGSKKLIESINKKEKIIFISSNAVYGNIYNDFKMQNEMYSNPSNQYGVSKINFEKYLLNNHKNISYILRPSTFHSKNFPKKYNEYLKFVEKNFAILPKKNVYRNFTSVELLTDTICKILKSSVNPGVYNVMDKNRISIYEFHDIIERSLNIKIKRIYLHNIFFKFFFYLDKILSKLNLYNKNIHLLGEANCCTNMCGRKIDKIIDRSKYNNLEFSLSNYIENVYSKNTA